MYGAILLTVIFVFTETVVESAVVEPKPELVVEPVVASEPPPAEESLVAAVEETSAPL